LFIIIFLEILKKLENYFIL